MAGPVIAVFCMAETGHFAALRPLISDLAERGYAVHVFTHRLFVDEVERCGGILVDLFGKYPLDQADNESIPFPCRYVSYAATYVEEIAEELRRIRPVLIVYETFAVIGRLAAQLLGVPYVNVSAGHNLDPAQHVRALQADARVAISDSCHRAVKTLRERYDLSDASPFSYITGLSPHLNICCEPQAFLTEEERRVFEPIAFYGCIPSWVDSGARSSTTPANFNTAPGALRIYACFGTIVPRYYAEAALGVFEALAECLGRMPQAQALIGLGGTSFGKAAFRRLERPNVKVVEYADQWAVLAATDVFLTHHGINSTHEAIIHRVPMLSYPFLSDQPALAERCRDFGIAIPLTASPRAPVTAEQIQSALHQILESRKSLNANLERVRDWELEVIAGRGTVLQMIEDLM